MVTGIVARLQAELGDLVTTDHAALDAVREDRSGHRSDGPPLAVVRPTSVEQVQTVLRIATETRTPIVPRGAGTGLAGGAIGGPGSIVLDLSNLNRILEINPEEELAVVEAGVLNGELNAALELHGRWYAPDPASRAISSIGGNIATNAGGLLCAKYGVTRESVLGLTVVRADGRLLRTGHRTVKGVTGYDLTALFTGSEGTLGVVVEATVRTRPIVRGETFTIAGTFDSIEDAAAACAGVVARGIRPSILELIDPLALSRIVEYLPREAVAGTPADGVLPGQTFLIAQADGGARDDAERIAAEFTAAGGRTALSTDAETGDRLLAIRRAMHPAMAAYGQVLIEDVAVPRAMLPRMFQAIAEIGERYGVGIPTVAHAGDGNLHPNFIYEGDTVPDAVWAAADELFRTAIELGGTLTGEHGIGVLKRRWLRDEIGDDSYELQREIKRVFDPLGILNPAVMFSDRE
ncbi:MAG TPA: FAD-linked oxidase C-terminal domain-containing protein [Candidatus Lumbricidophila sp.]|nr:FAD-linked oxidase C-terminal domain-containing protein [Candidatus Lumbricidophila sp.]